MGERRVAAPAAAEPAEVRLRILELTHRHDFTPEQVVERAAKLERYVTGGREEG